MGIAASPSAPRNDKAVAPFFTTSLRALFIVIASAAKQSPSVLHLSPVILAKRSAGEDLMRSGTVASFKEILPLGYRLGEE